MKAAENEAGARGNTTRLYLLSIMGDVEPVLSGPFDDERDRVEAARDYRRAHGDKDGLFRVDAIGDGLSVSTFSGRELEMPRNEWVADAWVEGRNALILNDGWYTLEVYGDMNTEGVPKRLGTMLFLFWGRAQRAGETWRTTGRFDTSEAERVILEPEEAAS